MIKRSFYLFIGDAGLLVKRSYESFPQSLPVGVKNGTVAGSRACRPIDLLKPLNFFITTGIGLRDSSPAKQPDSPRRVKRPDALAINCTSSSDHSPDPCGLHGNRTRRRQIRDRRLREQVLYAREKIRDGAMTSSRRVNTAGLPRRTLNAHVAVVHRVDNGLDRQFVSGNTEHKAAAGSASSLNESRATELVQNFFEIRRRHRRRRRQPLRCQRMIGIP